MRGELHLRDIDQGMAGSLDPPGELEIVAAVRRHGGRSASLSWARVLVELADVVVFLTENAAQPYVRAFPEELRSRRVAYILSGVEPPAPSHEVEPLSEQTDVLFVGRYVPHKGYDMFIDTAEQLVRDGVRASFWTLGGGPMRRESASVTDLGWHDEPHAVIARADIIVVPNRIAYFDLLPLEAAALGRGLVLTEVGGNIDQLERLPDSIGADPRALPEAVLAAVARKQASGSWGERNAVAFGREFTHVHMARRWAELIATISTAPEVGRQRGARVRRAGRSGDR